MSRKDYVKFAEVIAEARHMNPAAVVDYIALESAKVFRNDNPAFRPVQFFTACGYDTETAGRMRASI